MICNPPYDYLLSQSNESWLYLIAYVVYFALHNCLAALNLQAVAARLLFAGPDTVWAQLSRGPRCKNWSN